MLEKLIQAAIITFLLHLIAGLTPSNAMNSKAEPTLGTTPSPVASSLLRSLQ
ncbi:hypothetical protein [Calothrix sp. 336/3]|uniref:hypothetical protein n=1 Tax=Calothrix sp. 336/3 TaxID=1337936 RepID=UPI000AD16210|nr:hypothetical protein [Calothrix sp. 336/3]